MSQMIKIPDLGDAAEGTVVDISVCVGDTIEVEDALITLEGDKATMEIPSPVAGVVESIELTVGDTVKTGQAMMCIQVDDASSTLVEDPSASQIIDTHIDVGVPSKKTESLQTVVVPDLGDAAEGTVIDIAAVVGSSVKTEDPLITLEGEKAAMEIPSPFEGVIQSIEIQVGDTVTTGQPIMSMQVQGAETPTDSEDRSAAVTSEIKAVPDQAVLKSESSILPVTDCSVYAGPGVRRMAKQLGVDLARVRGSGRKGRLLKTDLEAYVRQKLSTPDASSSGIVVAPWPKVRAEGAVELKPLSKLRQVAGQFLHRNWVHIPHVTQFDQADFTDLERWRQSAKAQAASYECRLSPLVLVMKVLVESLRAFPQFNASLNEEGTALMVKQYYHFGVAVDSPNGLVVPVIRDVDQKDIVALSQEIAAVAEQARTQGLASDQMKGSSFTVSSLGGIGGMAFTPIVNAPDVAILGLSKTQLQPVYQDDQWVPRLMLPLSLSYDHRAIDGAEGVRFTVDLAQRLAQAHEHADEWWPKVSDTTGA